MSIGTVVERIRVRSQDGIDATLVIFDNVETLVPTRMIMLETGEECIGLDADSWLVQATRRVFRRLKPPAQSAHGNNGT